MSTQEQPAADRMAALMARLRRFGTAATSRVPDVSPSAMALVEYVASHPECGVRQIAEGLGLSPPTVSVGIKHLEETGVIERKVHPLDKRALQLSLTADGRELHQQVLGFRRQMLSKLLSGLSPQETVQLLDLLEKALDHAEFSDAESIETGDIE